MNHNTSVPQLLRYSLQNDKAQVRSYNAARLSIAPHLLSHSIPIQTLGIPYGTMSNLPRGREAVPVLVQYRTGTAHAGGRVSYVRKALLSLLSLSSDGWMMTNYK